MMFYLMLSAVAVCFGLLGFLLHAFYFSKSGTVEKLVMELDRLRKVLHENERNVRAAWEDVAGCRMQIRLLERQLVERNKEFHRVCFKALRSEEELSRLRRLAGNAHSPSEPLSSCPGPSPGLSDAGSEKKRNDSHLWREELNTMLSILDTMDGEANRKEDRDAPDPL